MTRTNQLFKFVRYNQVFTITEYVITEYDCILIFLLSFVDLLIGGMIKGFFLISFPHQFKIKIRLKKLNEIT